MATYPEYIKAAMYRAQYERMGDGKWFASIPGFAGLWADGSSKEEAQQRLSETLDGWIDVHVKVGKNQLPDVDGISIYSLPQKVDYN